MLILSSASEFVFESSGGRLGFIVQNHGVHHVEKCNIVTLKKVNRQKFGQNVWLNTKV